MQDQYVFVYDALLDALKSGKTTMQSSDFPEFLTALEDPSSEQSLKLNHQYEVNSPQPQLLWK